VVGAFGPSHDVSIFPLILCPLYLFPQSQSKKRASNPAMRKIHKYPVKKIICRDAPFKAPEEIVVIIYRGTVAQVRTNVSPAPKTTIIDRDNLSETTPQQEKDLKRALGFPAVFSS
jgi:hypothetical protein